MFYSQIFFLLIGLGLSLFVVWLFYTAVMSYKRKVDSDIEVGHATKGYLSAKTRKLNLESQMIEKSHGLAGSQAGGVKDAPAGPISASK